MSPIRLIIIGILLYIGYLLITGGSKKKGKIDKGEQDQPEVSDDVLMEDPICHKLVPKGQAVMLEEDGKTHYFCSDECCKAFADKKEQE